MKKLHPQIEFTHVLGELSVNRNDPCEVVRELISNSYDAKAKNIFYAPLEDISGFVFFDDGSGLSPINKKNGITPWEAFFSIGKSTKKKGDGIGYKCQGSKLCFACARIFVATRDISAADRWFYKLVENPRNNLNVNFDISPSTTDDLMATLQAAIPAAAAGTVRVFDHIKKLVDEAKASATLIVIEDLDTESFKKYFVIGKKYQEEYIYNYIRFCTSHGDVRKIEKSQGFSPAQIAQVSTKLVACNLSVMSSDDIVNIP